MRYQRILCLCAWVTLSMTPCFAHHMALVVSKDNSVQNVTSAHLAKLLKGEVKKWADGKDVVLVLHGNSPDEMVTLEHLNKMTADEVKAMVASHKDSIRTVGFVSERSITDQVVVVRIDGKLPMEAGYLPH
jgi:ABC-type phosphate transport system substrate-binding protein